MLHGFYSAEALVQRQETATVYSSTAAWPRYDPPTRLPPPEGILMACNTYYNATEAELHGLIALQDPVTVSIFLEVWCCDLLKQLNELIVRLARFSVLLQSSDRRPIPWVNMSNPGTVGIVHEVTRHSATTQAHEDNTDSDHGETDSDDGETDSDDEESNSDDGENDSDDEGTDSDNTDI